MADKDQTTKDNIVAEENLEVPELNEDNVNEESVDDTNTDTEELSSDDVVNGSLDYYVGDTVVVNYRIKEGDKSRVQPYTGIIIAINGSGVSKTFTVRRMAVGNIGVERIFPISSPNIESVLVKSRGKVRRSKLYYLRDRIGKSASKVKRKD